MLSSAVIKKLKVLKVVAQLANNNFEKDISIPYPREQVWKVIQELPKDNLRQLCNTIIADPTNQLSQFLKLNFNVLNENDPINLAFQEYVDDIPDNDEVVCALEELQEKIANTEALESKREEAVSVEASSIEEESKTEKTESSKENELKTRKLAFAKNLARGKLENSVNYTREEVWEAIQSYLDNKTTIPSISPTPLVTSKQAMELCEVKMLVHTIVFQPGNPLSQFIKSSHNLSSHDPIILLIKKTWNNDSYDDACLFEHEWQQRKKFTKTYSPEELKTQSTAKHPQAEKKPIHIYHTEFTFAKKIKTDNKQNKMLSESKEGYDKRYVSLFGPEEFLLDPWCLASSDKQVFKWETKINNTIWDRSLSLQERAAKLNNLHDKIRKKESGAPRPKL